MDELFDRILNLTSYISRRLLHFIEGLISRDVYRYSQDPGLSYSRYFPSSYNIISETVCDDSLASSSQISGLDASHPVPERRVRRVKKRLSLNSSSALVSTNHCFWNVPSIFQGVKLPISSVKFVWRLASSCCKQLFFHVQHTQLRFRRFFSRVQMTLHGSTDDIGWLQRTSGLPPVEDGTARFRELLHGIRDGKHTLPDSFVYLLIPGLFSNLSPLYFVSTKRFFSKMGLACHIAKIHSEAAVEHNARELKHYIEELYWGSGKRVMLLGHSKGGVDAAAALSIYSSDLKDKVAGLALVQSPYGGTPVASDILRKGQIADKETRKIMEFFVCKLIKGDMRSLEDLTYEKRKEFLASHNLPENIPLISFHSEASTEPSVLATLSHIAHAELPSLFCRNSDSNQISRKVPVVIPMAAAMAVSALHLKFRYGEKSDGLVTCRDAEVPGSVVVRPDKKLDHAWMVHTSWKKNYSEPDASEMCEALLTLLVEIGQMKQEQITKT